MASFKLPRSLYVELGRNGHIYSSKPLGTVLTNSKPENSKLFYHKRLKSMQIELRRINNGKKKNFPALMRKLMHGLSQFLILKCHAVTAFYLFFKFKFI